jgi:hypothetical protein
VNVEALLLRLVGELPEAIGAVVCDEEGETVMAMLGRADIPPEAEDRALEHVPRTLALEMPVGQFLLRLCGAEASTLIRTLDTHSRSRGAGAFASLHARYERVEVIVEPLRDDYYLVLVLDRPTLGRARFWMQDAHRFLAAIEP